MEGTYGWFFLHSGVEKLLPLVADWLGIEPPTFVLSHGNPGT